MIQFEGIDAPDVWDDIQPLLAEHWREIAHFEDIPLNPRKDMYFRLDAAGKLRIYTARFDGKLIGYVVFVVDHDIHYADSVQAKQDVLFLHPDFRNAGTGFDLIEFADNQLRAEGVQCVYHHVKVAHNFAPLLATMGYEKVETIHVKRLDRGR